MRADPVYEMAVRMGRDPRRTFDRRMPARETPAAPAAPAEPGEAEVLSFARFVIIVSVALAAASAVIAGMAWLVGEELARAGHSADTSSRQVVIGNDVLDVPENVIRFAPQRQGGALERLDLYFRWPDMAGYTESAKEEFNSPTVNPRIVFVTIEPRMMSQDMSGRIEPIYSKFMSGPEQPAEGGLVRRALDEEGGFIGEELLYEPGSPYPYAARCVKEDAKATPYCLRDIQAGRDLSVTYRVHRSLMAEWMAVEGALRAQVKRMLRE